ncbi:MAG: DUF6544 family protein [Gemmatimonadales bacterium]
MKLTLTVLGLLALVVILALSVGALQQKRSTAQLTETLLAAPRMKARAPVDFTRLDALPAPLARYLRHVLRDGQRPIRVARLSQVGQLRTDIEKDRWSPFEASQVIAPPANGFLWNARVRIAPLVHVRVRDAYVAGQGSGRVSLVSAISMASDSGRQELNSGSLHRYLAEAVRYPTALLPSAALQWSAINGTKAMATLTDAGITVSLEFWFNDAGEVTGIYSPGRWGRFDGEYVQTPWEGHFRTYQERNGMLVPTEGEVGWYSSGAWRSFGGAGSSKPAI